MSEAETQQAQEQAARLMTKGNEDHAASREFVVELLRLHYTRTRLDTLDELVTMVERALPGARTLPFFFDRWTLLLEGAIAGQLNKDSVKSLLRDLKLDPQKLELTVVEASAAHRILEDGEVVAIEPRTLLTGLTLVRPENVGIRGAIAVPLEVDGEGFGILCIFLPQPPSSAERARLELIAAHGAIAIRNERDFDEAQRLNGVDPITWVANRRAISDRLEAEIDRAKRYGRPLAVGLIEVVNFSELNQSFGANITNQVLRRTAMSISSGLRSPDATGRFDDAHFLLVLPETDAEGAVVARDRLLARLAELGGEHKAICAGTVATAPEDGWSPNDLLAILQERLASARGAAPMAAASNG